MIRLIIADDEDTIRKGLEKIVMNFDLDIKVEALAENGKQALELIDTYRPEILLLDINMPMGNGLEIIDQIKEIVPLCRIIIISGYDDFAFAQKAIKLGVFDYLLKPVNLANLRNTLMKAVEEYKRRLWEVNCLNQLNTGQESNGKDVTPSALAFISENYVNPDLSLSMVAEKFNVSNSYLTRLVKKRIGLGFSDYLTELRINQAKQILRGEK